MLRTQTLIAFLLLICGTCFSQKQLEQFYLQRSIKQEGQQFQFSVLEEGKKGVWFYNKQKFYFWYKAQHVLSTQGESSGVLLNGKFEAFYPDKQLSQKGKFNRGLKQGEWLYWREDGTLTFQENWKRGRLTEQRWYNERGEVHKIVSSCGKKKSYADADTIIIQKRKGTEVHYQYNHGEGTSTVMHKKNGKLHGKTKYYNDGKLSRSENYENGELIEDEREKEGELSDEASKTPFLKRLFKKKEKGETPQE